MILSTKRILFGDPHFYTLTFGNESDGWEIPDHYSDVIMGMMASQITSLTIVYSTIHSGADQRKHQSSASLAFVRVIHRGPVNSPHKWPVTWKMFPFDDVIMVPSGLLETTSLAIPNHIFKWLQLSWWINLLVPTIPIEAALVCLEW